MKKITESDVLNIINSSGKLEITADQLDRDLTELGMDSIAFIQIIVSLEETFGCEIPDSKLLFSEMNTICKITSVIQSLYNEPNEELQ